MSSNNEVIACCLTLFKSLVSNYDMVLLQFLKPPKIDFQPRNKSGKKKGTVKVAQTKRIVREGQRRVCTLLFALFREIIFIVKSVFLSFNSAGNT